MKKSRFTLGGLEQLLLLAIMRVDATQTWGIQLQREIHTITGYESTLGAVYVTLERLEKKGFLQSSFSAPTNLPGGRSKRLFVVTPAGYQALSKFMLAINKMVNV